MVSTRKRWQLNGRPLSQLDDFDQVILFGNTMSDRQEKVTVNEGTVNQEITVNNSGSNSAANENLVNVKTLERCFNEKVNRQMGNIVDIVEDRIQNTFLTAIDSIITPEIKLAIRSMNVSSGRDATSVRANSQSGEHIGITAPFENVSVKNNELHVFNTNDETRNNIPDEVNDLSVPGAHFDRQPLTHHNVSMM